VILKLEDNTTERFSIPKGQKFMVNGQETDAFGLKKGMTISATKVVEEPETVVEHQKQLTGSMPPPPPPPPADQPILVVMMARATPPPTPSEPAQELPKTGSLLPLIGLLGAVALAAGLGLRAVRLTR
jgi:LPXTG-motif cell wall-anchored protein